MAQLDPFLARLRNLWSQLKMRASPRKSKHPPYRVLGYNTGARQTRGRALLIYEPNSLMQDGPPRHFNPGGAVVQIAAALNEGGFVVDAIGIDDADFQLTKTYDAMVAHAGPAYSRLGRELDTSCRVLDYSTGCHWRAFNEQSERRYREFAERRRLKRVPSVLRPLVVAHEDYAATRADLVVCLGEETAGTFAPFAKNVRAINNSAYASGVQTRKTVRDTDCRSFLYSGGNGNVQKGLDILIEAFAAEPDLHLYLDTPLESEILTAYGRELRQPNLHYCEFKTRVGGGLQKILERCAFTVQAGMNSGQSTSLIACLASGLVPVVTTESNLGLGYFEVHIEAPSVPAIRAAIRTAAALPRNEIESRSRTAVQTFQESFSPDAYRSGFGLAIGNLLSK